MSNAFLSTNTAAIEEGKLKLAIRDGVELEKGVVITEEYLKQHEDLFIQYAEFFTAYPDLYLDIIKPVDSNFELFFYQRIVLRALMRYKSIYITACRAFSKSFITILGMMLQCTFMPGTKRFICAPNKNQSAQIAKEKIVEIYDHWPLLRKEVVNLEMVLCLMLLALWTPLVVEEGTVSKISSSSPILYSILSNILLIYRR